jgi:hypothetical protein
LCCEVRRRRRKRRRRRRRRRRCGVVWCGVVLC